MSLRTFLISILFVSIFSLSSTMSAQSTEDNAIDILLVNQDGSSEIRENDDLHVAVTGDIDSSQLIFKWERNGIALLDTETPILKNSQMKTFMGDRGSARLIDEQFQSEFTPKSNHTDHTIRGYEFSVTIFDGDTRIGTTSTEIIGPSFSADWRCVKIGFWDNRGYGSDTGGFVFDRGKFLPIVQGLFQVMKDETNANCVLIANLYFQDEWGSSLIYSLDEPKPPTGLVTAPDFLLAIAVQEAHALGFKVAFIPEIWLQTPDGGVRSSIGATPEAQIPPDPQWYNAYLDFILDRARFAEDQSVEMLYVGAEFPSTESNTAYWEKAILETREVYKGTLTYQFIACCKDALQRIFDVRWLSKLDLIGFGSIFEVDVGDDPTIGELRSKYQEFKSVFQTISTRANTPAFISEANFLSADRAAQTHRDNAIPDWQEQADIFEGILRVFQDTAWLDGITFGLWPFYLDAYRDSNYITGLELFKKPATRVLSSWYDQSHPIQSSEETSGSDESGINDRDGDGIPDDIDYCPDFPGKPITNGC